MKVFLFDMDGTLTPPRKEMTFEMASALAKLSLKHKVGIVTGSGLEYLLEQTSPIRECWKSNPGNFYLMPCNGTKLYRYDSKWRLQLEHEVSMIETLGRENYKRLVSFICLSNYQAIDSMDLCPTGTFIQYRGSMINWCPIGRDAGDELRSEFVDLDTQVGLRERLRKDLLNYIDFPLDVALGGSTSLDIYPPGWDKTYCLRHFPETSDYYFVGDKCEPPGNDASIFTACAPNSFITQNPEETLKIIYENFLRIDPERPL